MAKAVPAVEANQEAEWRAESDLRTLVDAEEIKKDPKRLAAAKAKGREQAANLKKIA